MKMKLSVPKYLTENNLLSRAGYNLFEALNDLRVFDGNQKKTGEDYASEFTCYMAYEGAVAYKEMSDACESLYSSSVVSDLVEPGETTEPNIKEVDKYLARMKIKIIEEMKSCIEEYAPSKEEDGNEAEDEEV